MKPTRTRSLIGGAVLAASLPYAASTVWAADDSPIYTLTPAFGNTLILADADTASTKNETGTATTPVFTESMFTANKTHQYLGLGALGLVGLALLAPKEEDGAHHNLAIGATTLGVGAVATGLTFHYKDMNFSNWSDPDTLHALLGILGTVGFLMAVSDAPAESHTGAGILGTVAMLAAIKIEW